MLLNFDLLFHFIPFWYFGPHMGGISPFLIFFGAMILFSMLRRAGGYNRRRGGYYRPGPHYPRNYNPGPPYQGHIHSDTGRPEQNQGGPGGSGPYNPYAGQYNAPYGPPYNTQYGGYGANGEPVPPTVPGQPTIRVDSQSNGQANGQGRPTMRVDLPATTVRMEGAQTVNAGGHPTTPLGNAPQLPPERARIAPGEVGQAERSQDQI